MKKISFNDIHISESSYVDPYGFVFHWNNEFYRAIKPAYESFYRSLFTEGIIENLSEKFHLVQSEITDYSIPEINCNLVIKHRKIEPATYCVEWCPSMFKKAAIVTLELNIALLDYNCILQDAYPWNIIFVNTKPVFIDLTSIKRIDSQLLWPAYQQFINFFLNPLKMFSMGKGKIARLYLYDYVNGITLNDLNSNYSLLYSLKHPIKTALSSLYEIITNKIQSNQSLKLRLQRSYKKQRIDQNNIRLRKTFFNKLTKKINNIDIFEAKTSWKDYYKNIEKSFNVQNKVEIVDNLISELKPKCVLDIGSNTGIYSIIAAKKGIKVISLDSSEYCIEELFKKSDREGYSITPVIGDVLSPTPPFGFLSKQFPSLIKRIKSDVVLCLGLMHHLHINGRQSFDRIALLLNELSNKAVIFEYIDSTDNNIHLLDHGREINYSIDTVSRSLSEYFNPTAIDDHKSRNMSTI